MHRPTAALLVTTAAATLALTTAGPAAATPGALAAPTAPTAQLPRSCVAEFTTTDRAGTVTSVVYEDGSFLSLPLTGLKVAPGTRLVQPVGFDPEATSPVMTSLVITRTGVLQSLTSTLEDPGSSTQTWTSKAPVRIGHGWAGVKAMALPGTTDDPYLFAVLGGRLNRYSLGAKADGTLSVRNAPHAATSGFAGVRSLTWTRATTVRGTTADVLVGLDGARLVEYTVPRAVNPRVINRDLGRGWGGVNAVSAGLCFSGGRNSVVTRSTPLLARVGRDVRLYLDRDNRDGSGRDIANYGRVGAWPGA